MVATEYFSTLSREELDELRRRRYNVRAMYLSEQGIEHFMKLLDSARVFSKIDPSEVTDIGARNLMVDVLEEMGLFDEQFIRFVLASLREFPTIPSNVHPIEDGEYTKE